MEIYVPAGARLRNIYRSETCSAERMKRKVQTRILCLMLFPRKSSFFEKIKRHLEDKRYSAPSFPESVLSRIF